MEKSEQINFDKEFGIEPEVSLETIYSVIDKARRYNFTIDFNAVLDKYRLPYRLQNGLLISWERY